MLNVGEMFYILTLLVLKVSISIFYLHFLQTKAQRLVIYTAVSVSTVFSIAALLFVIFQCGYYHGAQDFIQKKLANQCVSNAAGAGMIYAHSTVTMLTDWTFLLMPLWLVNGSSMTTKSKVSLGLFLLCVSMSGIASILRFPYIHTLFAPKLDFFGKLSKFCKRLRIELIRCSHGQGYRNLVCPRTQHRNHGRMSRSPAPAL
jgi:hypothetical protein